MSTTMGCHCVFYVRQIIMYCFSLVHSMQGYSRHIIFGLPSHVQYVHSRLELGADHWAVRKTPVFSINLTLTLIPAFLGGNKPTCWSCPWNPGFPWNQSTKLKTSEVFAAFARLCMHTGMHDIYILCMLYEPHICPCWYLWYDHDTLPATTYQVPHMAPWEQWYSGESSSISAVVLQVCSPLRHIISE